MLISFMIFTQVSGFLVSVFLVTCVVREADGGGNTRMFCGVILGWTGGWGQVDGAGKLKSPGKHDHFLRPIEKMHCNGGNKTLEKFKDARSIEESKKKKNELARCIRSPTRTFIMELVSMASGMEMLHHQQRQCGPWWCGHQLLSEIPLRLT